jgi:aminoglycoside phosphotransferase (APT) family kinase protein
MAEWTAERAVDAELARALIVEQFPQLAAARVERFGEGWDNTALLVDGGWVFRFPRRAIAVPLIELESAVLPLIADRLPLPVPVPLLIGRPTERFPWPFAGYRMLAGRTATSARPDDASRLASAEPLARFLDALHTMPTADAERAGAGPDQYGRLEVDARRPKLLELIARLERLGLPIDTARIRRLVEETPPRCEGMRPALVHGDLYGRHILVDAAGMPCGVIDWGDVHLGGVAIDLGIAHSYLPRAGHDAFRRAYGEIRELDWAIGRYRAITGAVNLVLYGEDIGDRDALGEGIAALERIAG